MSELNGLLGNIYIDDSFLTNKGSPFFFHAKTNVHNYIHFNCHHFDKKGPNSEIVGIKDSNQYFSFTDIFSNEDFTSLLGENKYQCKIYDNFIFKNDRVFLENGEFKIIRSDDFHEEILKFNLIEIESIANKHLQSSLKDLLTTICLNNSNFLSNNVRSSILSDLKDLEKNNSTCVGLYSKYSGIELSALLTNAIESYVKSKNLAKYILDIKNIEDKSFRSIRPLYLGR